MYLFRSDDGGQNFGYADGPLGGPRAFYHLNHPDNHAIVFHPEFDGGSNQTLFVASDGGIARSGQRSGSDQPQLLFSDGETSGGQISTTAMRPPSSTTVTVRRGASSSSADHMNNGYQPHERIRRIQRLANRVPR